MIGIQRFQTEQESRPLLRLPKPIDVVQIQSTATTVFTAQASADFHVQSLVAANVSGSDTTITVYLVPSGGSAGASNMIVHARKLPANSSSWIFDGNNPGLMQPGAFIQALCATNDDVNMYGWGYDYYGQEG